ncbi:hypothetical protein [Marinimicrobium alkaliphilum]|uniref:hypothetical protein n=1 Tax=Marinimicrobium alkaliphilum TaxID=2202654 RepID=UPI000DBA3859|nr:hypothetical protein [Marinimicrobium alkaliphilum]
MRKLILLSLLAANIHGAAYAQTTTRIEVELETTRIQSHRESPMLMYIIPWQETPLVETPGQRRIVIHDLFGDFYEPIDTEEYSLEQTPQ